MRISKLLALLLTALLLAIPAALAEGLEIEEEPVVEESEDIVLSEDIDNAAEEEDFMLFSDEPVEKGYADFLGEENPADIPIDAAHFPDEGFRTCISEQIDGDGNGVLSQAEIDEALEIIAGEYQISDLTGIEFFPNLISLECTYQQVSKLDLSNNSALEVLCCAGNPLTGLDVSHNPALRWLECFETGLQELDVSHNPALEYLACDNNSLVNLDISHNTALSELYCFNNALTSLDLSNNAQLSILYCFHNDISTLDFTGCDALKQMLLDDPEYVAMEEEEGVLGAEKEDRVLYFDAATTLTADGSTIREGGPIQIDISRCEITVKNKTYTGKALKPSVTVEAHNGAMLEKGRDYTVSYKNNTKVGTATVTVKGIGNYTGSKKATFKINPKPTTLSKVTPGKKKLTVTWKKQTKQVSGYQIQYGTKKDFSNAKKVTVSGAKTVKKVIKSLKAKKYYYVRIRTYKTVSGKKYYSSWSEYKKVKTK